MLKSAPSREALTIARRLAAFTGRPRHPALLAAYLVPVFFAVLAFIFPPVLGSDFCFLLAGWDSFLRGGPFHSLAQPLAQDLGSDGFIFISWWSPGPAILVGSLEHLVGSLRFSVAFWLFAAGVATVDGWARVSAHFGFERRIVAWTALVGALGWHSLYCFRIFNAGDLFFTALAPWALYAVLRPSAARPVAVLWISALITIGALIKLSFLVLAPCLLAASWLTLQPARLRLTGAGLKLALYFGLALGLSWLAVDQLFLSHGANPASITAPDWTLAHWINSAALSFVLPLFSVFSLVSISGNVFDALGWPHTQANPIFLGLCVVATALLYRKIALTIADTHYRCAVFAFAAGFFVLFTYFYGTKAAIDQADRHFRPLGLLLLPGLIHLAFSSRSDALRWLLRSALGFACVWGVLSYVLSTVETTTRRTLDPRGFAHFDCPPQTLEHLLALDRTLPIGPNTLFVVPDLETALALPGRRTFILAYQPSLAPERWNGRVKDLVVVAAPSASPTETDALLARFSDYARADWSSQSAGGWLFFHQGETPLPPAL